MRKLCRDGVCCPKNWRASLYKRKNFDLAAFEAAAAAFELLPLNSDERRAGFRKWPQALGSLQQRTKGQEFPSAWGRAKKTLAAMTKKKCSYCECSLSRKRNAQVDHFRPKDVFPALAYDWDNYFLACGHCNGAKWNKWPEEGAYLRPDEGDPPSELIFSKDGTVRSARPESAAERTIRDLDLNEKWLVETRRDKIAHALADIDDLVADLPGIPAHKLALRHLERLRARLQIDFYVAIIQCCERAIEEGRHQDPPKPTPP